MIWFILLGVGCLAVGYYVGWKEAVYKYGIDEKAVSEHERWKSKVFGLDEKNN